MKQVVVVKWGRKFGPDYVNRMYGMVARHITGPFKLACLTDDAQGLRAEVEAHPLPELGCEWPRNSIGKWRKLVLWGESLPGLSGPTLFIDLDSVIVDNIDGYFEYGRPEDVILARNWAKPLHRLGQTSVFRFPVGRYPQILAAFRENPQAVADRCHFEQHYITEAVPGGIKLWPERWTRHFRLHCLPPFPLRYFMQARLPKGAKIVTFPGGPNPSEVIDGRWFEEQTQRPSRWQHVLNTFRPALRIERSAHRHLTRFVLPVSWLQKNWAE
jgi:hypothetical protein